MDFRINPIVAMIIFVCAATSFLFGYGYFDIGPQSNNALLVKMQQAKKVAATRTGVTSKDNRPASEERVAVNYEIPALDAITKSLLFVMNLKSAESRIYSQNMEDGVLETIFERIGTKHKYYVEFGVEHGTQCNTRLFREKHGWTGLLMDGGTSNPAINLQRELIYPTNIVKLFKKYQVPKAFDLLSVDTDFKDFWLIQRILAAGYRPRVIISEINSFLGPRDGKTVPLDFGETRGDMSQYYGFSVTAGWHLGRFYGYSLVYCETSGVNCIWVIDGHEGFGKGIQISNYLNGSSLWHPSCCLPHKPDNKKRPFVTITSTTKFN